MAEANHELSELLARPRETLGLELKQWIDPSTPEGRAKIAKGCMALRNNDGGRLIIGFKNDGTPDVDNAPIDVEGMFNTDDIQAIVSRHSAEQFAVEVSFGKRDGQSYPVIAVPSGVRTPVAAKADLRASDGTILIRDHAVYVRSLRSNDTVSSTEARRGDWENLTRVCFDNREADVGGFVRRHLAALNLESLAALVPAFAQMLHKPTDAERLLQELDHGRTRFEEACQQRSLTLPDIGFRESAIVVAGDVTPQEADREFRYGILRHAPSLTGWPPFVDLHGSNQRRDHPYVSDDGWQALVVCLPPDAPVVGYHLDFWRLTPKGLFYQLRGFHEDLVQLPSVPRHISLEYANQVVEIAEIIWTALAFARTLGCQGDKTNVLFRFRWSKLSGRVLQSANPLNYLMFREQNIARQAEFVSPLITVPLETPPTAIASHTENVVRGLFNLFGGMVIPSRLIENTVSEFLFRNH